MILKMILKIFFIFNKMEENWVLMTVLHLTWDVANNLSDEERAFLLKRAEDVDKFMQAQHQMQQAMMNNSSGQEQVLPDTVPNGPEMVLNQGEVPPSQDAR